MGVTSSKDKGQNMLARQASRAGSTYSKRNNAEIVTSAEDKRRNKVKPSGIEASDLELAEIDDIEALK